MAEKPTGQGEGESEEVTFSGRLRSLTFLIALSIALVAACAGQPPLPSAAANFRQGNSRLSLTIEAVKETYSRDEPIPVRLLITNSGGEWAYLPSFEEGRFFYDWLATAQDGKALSVDKLLIDRSGPLKHGPLPPRVAQLAIAPGTTLRLETNVEFPFMSTHGRPLLQGKISVRLRYHPERKECCDNDELYRGTLDAKAELTFGQ